MAKHGGHNAAPFPKCKTKVKSVKLFEEASGNKTKARKVCKLLPLSQGKLKIEVNPKVKTN